MRAVPEVLVPGCADRTTSWRGGSRKEHPVKVGWSDLDICDGLNFRQPWPRSGPRGYHLATEVFPSSEVGTEIQASSGSGGPERGGSTIEDRTIPSEV